MMDWLAGRCYRLPLLLGVYFAAHVLVRTAMSTSLDFDESEQVLLSQFWMLGYNSQPPLYTWMQSGLFHVLGYSVFSLALLKNGFIWLTYCLVFESIRKATGNLWLASVATLGMLTIPQIAWESHRDLSHTVAATFATTLLCYAVISLGKEVRDQVAIRWYVLIGIAVGLGALFKYNFVIVVAAFMLSGLSIPRWRPLLLDRRILASVLIAAGMVLPHAWWMLKHPDLVSSKTVATLTTGQSEVWAHNVGNGLAAMTISLLGCCLLTLCVFFVMFVRRQGANVQIGPMAGGGIEWDATRLLLQRFLLTVLAVLMLFVLSGQAVEFKNRWFQPFICLLPAYLTLAFAPSVLARRRAMNVSAVATLGLMLVILVAVAGRPVLGRYRGSYTWLNIPYGDASKLIQSQCSQSPQIILTANARTAGNLKVQYPDSIAVSCDARHLVHEIRDFDSSSPLRVLAFVDSESEDAMLELAAVAEETLNANFADQGDCRAIDVRYIYGAAGDTRHFVYCEWQLRTACDADTASDAVADCDADNESDADAVIASSSIAKTNRE